MAMNDPEPVALPNEVSDTDSLGSVWASDSEDELVNVDRNPGPSGDRNRPYGPVHFMEIFSNPRVGPFVERQGMTCGPAIDLGTGWNLSLKSAQQNLLRLIYQPVL